MHSSFSGPKGFGGTRPSILLVSPRRQPGEVPQQDLEVEVLLGYLRKKGFPVHLVDAQFSNLDPRSLVDTIGVSSSSIIFWNLRSRLDIQVLEEALPLLHAMSPRPLMLAGGRFAACYDLEILDCVPGLDGVVRGELELSMESLAEVYSRGGEWQKERGISCKTEGGSIRNPPRPLMECLDSLPMASDDLFHPSRLERGQHILLSRGCNSDCLYCGLQTPYREEFPLRTRFWRSRSAVSVVDEIEHYYRVRGVSHFVLDSFVSFGYESGGGQIAETAREILRRRLPVTFSFVTHPHALRRHKSTLPLLKEAGLTRLRLGIDTGLPRFLAVYKLEFSLEDIFEALRSLHYARIDFVPSFVFYDPYLEVEEIVSNLEFLESIAPWFSHMRLPYSHFLIRYLLGTVLQVRPHTPIYAVLREEGLASRVDPLREDPVVIFKHPKTGKVHRLHRAANRLLMRAVRPALESPDAVNRFPQLGRFPLDLVRKIVELVQQQPGVEEESAIAELRGWAEEFLPADLPGPLRPIDECRA